MKTYNGLCIEARNALREYGAENPNLEARSLVALASCKSLDELIRDYMLYASDEIEHRVLALVDRRIAGEPLAYILGSWEFYGLDMTVTPDVLVPRIDTEVLVDEALNRIPDRSAELRILDLCCGSGCIACALGVHLPKAKLVLGDLSNPALHVARNNIMKHNLGARSSCVQVNALNLPPENLGRFDLIVSNPPYITPAEIQTLDPSVRDFEPMMALDGGEDGYMFYRSIIRKWKRLLREGGWMLFEVGEGQAEYVKEHLRRAGFSRVTAIKDTGCTERVVAGQL